MKRIPNVRPIPEVRTSPQSIARAVDDEMRFHLQMRVEDLMRDGKTQHEAESIAEREFGDTTAARQELMSIDARHARGGARREWWRSVGQDVRFGLRGLRARPSFAITVLITLALGIGANAAIFSVVNAVLLRPLPFTQPDRLVTVWETIDDKVINRSEESYPDYLDMRARNHVFSALGGYTGGSFVLGGAQAATVTGARVTSNFFDVIGVRALAGRTFQTGEDAVGAAPVIMLTYGFWQRQFGGDRGIVGKTITLDGARATVVGVLPRGFQLAGRNADPDVVSPLNHTQSVRDRRGNHWLNVVARLRDGVTTEDARRDLSSIMHALAVEYPADDSGRDAQIVPLREAMIGSVRPILVLLYCAVVVVLLVACVNVANLLLMRGADRQREIAVRIALGAGKGRLVRQLLTESVLLSVVGGILGLGIAKVGVQSLVNLVPPTQARAIPALASAGLDPWAVGYALLLSLAAGIAFGIIPALRMSQTAVSAVLKSAARGAIGGGSRLRDTLVIGELALTVVLMSAAVLFGRSLVRLMAIDPGFRVDQIVTSRVVLPPTSYRDARAQNAFFTRYIDRLRGLPGVDAVSMVSQLPLIFGNSASFLIAGQPIPTPGREPSASYRAVAPDYFATMGIPILSGRGIRAGDDAPAREVAVVNRAFMNAYLDGRDAVGQRLIAQRDTITIVGLAGDVPIGNLDAVIPPTLYLAFTTASQSAMSIVVRTRSNAAQLTPAMRQALTGIDPTVAATTPVDMSDMVVQSPSVFMRRFPLYLVGAFALTALLLAIVGIYGVVSYSVAQRAREMGIRMALGAQPRNLVAIVVQHGGTVAIAGIALGVTGALMLGRFAEKLLYGVHASDPATYGTVAGVLALVSVAATLVPARRATRVDPATALRAD